ncbi:hypothetical protein COCON_G00018730 [Conger conger]|uniref:Uncharacterized protein n=1 Tax=Conger conger TaxID=82655 RepID=A0A9Q1I915_CONCO|nr:hypothetical protein COCON_G00018730 [Conger conger]
MSQGLGNAGTPECRNAVYLPLTGVGTSRMPALVSRPGCNGYGREGSRAGPGARARARVTCAPLRAYAFLNSGAVPCQSEAGVGAEHAHDESPLLVWQPPQVSGPGAMTQRLVNATAEWRKRGPRGTPEAVKHFNNTRVGEEPLRLAGRKRGLCSVAASTPSHPPTPLKRVIRPLEPDALITPFCHCSADGAARAVNTVLTAAGDGAELSASPGAPGPGAFGRSVTSSGLSARGGNAARDRGKNPEPAGNYGIDESRRAHIFYDCDSVLRITVSCRNADESDGNQAVVSETPFPVPSLISLGSMMKFAWDNYKHYAWGKNELRPLTKNGHIGNMFGDYVLSRPQRLPLGAVWGSATPLLFSRISGSTAADRMGGNWETRRGQGFSRVPAR